MSENDLNGLQNIDLHIEMRESGTENDGRCQAGAVHGYWYGDSIAGDDSYHHLRPLGSGAE